MRVEETCGRVLFCHVVGSENEVWRGRTTGGAGCFSRDGEVCGEPAISLHSYIVPLVRGPLVCFPS